MDDFNSRFDCLRGLDQSFSRRDFLIITAGMVVGLSAPGDGRSEQSPLIIVDQALGLVIADPTRCVGCRRCELACTEFNYGAACPTMAGIKVGRNLNFGAQGLYAGRRGHGTWGDGLVVPDLCKQCPHPVPCANACPNDAIVVKPPTNARTVDPEKCIGCRMCQGACPWGMMSFDSYRDKAVKCFLCDGRPKCVEACPAGALSYVKWMDVGDKSAPRVVPTAVVDPEKARACNECHKK
ncbi:MAG: 4Fe-4S dicluster domain-containing protein [Pseudomonadota bacterium]